MTKAREIHKEIKVLKIIKLAQNVFCHEHESFEVVKINGRNIEIDKLKMRSKS